MSNTLFLRFEGPLQSWGERARWSIRDTAPEPTKSGVVGFLACALGLSADEDLCQLSRSIKLGVRCDRPGVILRDYHTVTGGVMSAEGKIKINATTRLPETVVSERYYLCDASFLIAVQSDQVSITRLAEAVQTPTWPMFLGRKSCPLSRPPFEGTGKYPSLEEALASWPMASLHETGLVQVRAVLECAPEVGVQRRDEVASRSRRTFYPRYTCEMLLNVTVHAEVT